MVALLTTHDWTLTSIVALPERPLLLQVMATRSAVPCPDCGTPSARRHSQYWRRPLDLPWRGSTVRLRVRVRRFFCDALACPRRTFAERFAGLLGRRAQRTDAATDLLPAMAWRAGGEVGAQLARAAGLPVSPDTLLRLLRADGAAAPVPTPRVLGVDDGSLRRGQR